MGEEKAGSWINPGAGLSQKTTAKGERLSYGFVESVYNGLAGEAYKEDGAAMSRQGEWKGRRLHGWQILVGWDKFLSWGA